MLKEFCKPGSTMVLPGCEGLVEPQRTVITTARAALVFVVDAHRSGMRCDREFLKRTPHCLEGSWGACVIDELGPRNDDLFVTKRRYSGFFNTDLDVALKDMTPSSLWASSPIFAYVRPCIDAFFNGYKVVVPEDYVARQVLVNRNPRSMT